MRAGEAMEKALLEVCKAVPIGKILIQSVDKEPRVRRNYFLIFEKKTS